MDAYTRFRVADPEAFLEQARELVALWADQPGLLEARVLRSTDEETLFLLATRWEGAGAYRRALSRVDVRMVLMPMALEALDEAGTFETALALEGETVVTRNPDSTPGQGR